MQNAIALIIAKCYCDYMDAKTYIQEQGRESAKKVAEDAGTTFEYFNQIAYGHRRPSIKLAQKLVASSNGKLEFVALLTAMKSKEAA